MTLGTANLTERAMLINLSISQWTATKNDKQVNREVAQKHGNQENMGRFNKSLVAKSALETIKKLAGAARTEHYARTLPWRDGGDRVLSNTGYFEYSKVMRDKIRLFDEAVNEFCSNYDSFVQDARIALNGLFNQADYPTNVRDKFCLSFDVFPLPVSQDFRVNLGDAETARIRQEIESTSNQMLNKAMAEVWTRLQSVVSHMAERLKAYEETTNGKVLNPFRDSLVTNISDLLAILPSLNLTEDANVTRFADEIQTYLTLYSPSQLRESETARKDVAMRADEILSKMAAFVA